ncbi:sensor histidine kinase [Siminovitchia fordii]|uniref:histidine kinase n=1 Tax=Siminovitchia fordii TaxID=254759 RepID=A0ABQ4K358_9BACI|nr:sensor histidine kinase [Siminovitchia fordii]GIN19430.1 sensor histidine kinase [Siminovitchia fordii]
MSLSKNREMQIFILMLLIVPLAGEVKFYPFNNTFRVSFGMPTFFFFILILKRYPAILSGVFVGFSVVAFRTFIDIQHFPHSFQAHYPTFFYYFTFGCLFYFLKVRRFYGRPLLIGSLGVLFDILASSAELTFQYIAFQSPVTYEDIRKVSIIAVFRGFFTVGFFNLIMLYEAQLRKEEMHKQNAKLVMIISNLYEEAVHLHKTLKNSENVTKEAYNLYQLLKEIEVKKTSVPIERLYQIALKIAGESHEVKKDNQRIYSGLSKLISDEGFSEYMDTHELMNITAQANQKYARLLGKNIEISFNMIGEHPKYHVYKVLSIVNNLVINSIEAIKGEGVISIYVFKYQEVVEFQIRDDGPGIGSRHRRFIYKPGFTTKYDENGKLSTGIGLTYVKELVESLGGDISMQSKPEITGTCFKIRLPVMNLVQSMDHGEDQYGHLQDAVELKVE